MRDVMTMIMDVAVVMNMIGVKMKIMVLIDVMMMMIDVYDEEYGDD